MEELIIYTDGSCNHEQSFGAWAALIINENNEILLKGTETDTTHNRMELLAVIRGLEYSEKNYISSGIKVYSDSQYVVNLPIRQKKLEDRNFRTRSGNITKNSDLLKIFFKHIESKSISFIKIKAHQKASMANRYNRLVDKTSRRLVREQIKIRDKQK